METKPAVYTTEFWITVIVAASQFLNLAGVWDFVSNWHSGIILAVATAFYTVARGLAKSHAPADPNLAATYRIFPRSADGVKRS